MEVRTLSVFLATAGSPFFWGALCRLKANGVGFQLFPDPTRMKTGFALLVLLLTAGCDSGPRVETFSGLQQGTSYHIKVVLDAPERDRKEIEGLIERLFLTVDLALSTYREDSDLSRFNRSESRDWVEVAPSVVQLTALARGVSEKTQGCFDPTIKPLFDLWGFSRAGPQRQPEEAEIRRVQSQIGIEGIELDLEGHRLRKKDPSRTLDLSSIGQGYTVGEIARALEARGLTSYLVEIGGELKVRGLKPDGSHWRVAVEKPTPTTAAIQALLDVREVRGTAIMTAGTYRHFFEQDGQVFSHILDPRAGRPVQHNLLSVTVLHEDPTLADLWDTALLCVGEEEAKRLAVQEDLRVLLISDHDHQLIEWTSPAFIRESEAGVQLIHPETSRTP